MGYFDEMKAMLGKGMNAADRKTQELRLQTELSKIGSSLDSAYAALGKASYSHPALAAQIQRECPDEYRAVASLLQDEQSIRGRIDGLQHQIAASAPAPKPARQFFCAKCGTPVTLDIAYCPSCGDNLSELKARYRMCPNCNTYHTSDSMFCMQCGSKTVEVPVAQKIQNTAAEEITQGDDAPMVDPSSLREPQSPAQFENDDITEVNVAQIEEPSQAPSTTTCPNCGARVAKDDVFCDICGTRLAD
ncbi:MAG: zinc-ribbon domain-containing protein [Coriobacteriales bacterium]|nr:zinc-ribbon domain-containing protein [Coriobacteriales bacterium]